MGLRLVIAGGVRLLLTAALTSPANAQELHPKITGSTMPFELISDFVIVVQGQIGELNGLRFILDTGSSHSVIDRRVADRLGLPRHQGGKVMNFNRHIPVEWADVPELRVGPIRATAFRVLVANLAEQSEFAQGADGILGLDLLSRARKLAVDYEKKLVSVDMDPQGKEGALPSNGFVVPVVVQGVPMHWLVDTGFRDILVYKDRLRSALPHLRTQGEPKKVVIGRLKATQVNLPGVQILGHDAVTRVFLIDRPKSGIGTVDGYLGPTSLHAKRLELDFASKVLRWQ
jgi:predicted aspartyl protease